MHLRLATALLLAVLLAASSAFTPAAAQPPREARPPRALARQLFADLEPDNEFKRNGIESVEQGTVVERPDLDGDGVGEWLVKATRFCGAANCQYWVYRRLPDGRFQQVFTGGGVGLEVLPMRSRGWNGLRSRAHMSAYETFIDRWEFTGRRYVWRDTEYRGDSNTPHPRVIYHLSISHPEARRRRLMLDPVDAGGGLRVAARYQLCGGTSCTGPELVLRSERLPAGRMCVAFRATGMDGAEHRAADASRWCGKTAPVAGRPSERELVLRPLAADWARLYSAIDVDLTGPGLPGRIASDATSALLTFASRLDEHYRLPCHSAEECAAADR